MADKPTIDSVTTFVAELPGISLSEEMKKFQGKKTAKSLAAARRIAAKKKIVKIPRNLLRKLYRVTGGFHVERIEPLSKGVEFEEDIERQAVKLGGLLAIFNGTTCTLKYNGVFAAKISGGWNGGWLDEKRVRGVASSLGEPWQPPEELIMD